MQSKPKYPASDDARLAVLAARQHGVVAYRQLVALGYSRHDVRWRVAAARLHCIHRGVYAVGHTRLTAKGRWMAAVLACGPGAVLSHRDAAALHDLRRAGSGAIHVTSPTRHGLQGIRCHWARHLQPEDATVIDGIPVTTLERTLLDLAETQPRQFHAALEQAQRAEQLDQRRLDELIARSPGRRGLRPLTAALADLTEEPGWTQSELERRFRALCADHGLPIPLTNQYVEGELVDAVWPERRVVVEVDSWRFHKTRRSFEADRARDAKLTAAGYRVFRVTYERMRDDPAGLAEQLRRALSAPPARGAAASGR